MTRTDGGGDPETSSAGEAEGSGATDPGTGDADAVTIRFWGVRGSVPTTCASAAGFGGNTACVEVLTPAGGRIIFDAGTGIRLLGRELVRGGRPVSADLFLTHFHWDHIQGLPFFEPLLSSGTAVRLHAPRQGTLDGSLLLGKLASPTYVPLPLQAFAAAIDFHDVTDETWVGDDVQVSSVRASHPAHTRAYRLDAAGVSLAYVPDHEIEGSLDGAASAVERLVHGADVLVHDAMFTASEYAARAGWGHSSMEQAVSLARRAGVRLLCLFHHDPARTDRELVGLLDTLRAGPGAGDAAGMPRIEAAAEGDVIRLGHGRDPVLAGLRRRCVQAGERLRSSSSNC
jgi:phosphoribosyl 1,2-cyclic phosphodiesterase